MRRIGTILFLAATSPALTFAAESNAPAANCAPLPYEHVLEEHVFPPLHFVERAFTDTTAHLALGVAKRETLFDNQSLAIAGLSPILDVQARVWDSLAVSLGMTGSLIAGINSNAAVQFGASTSYSISAGAVYEFFRKGPDAVSFGLIVRRPHTYAVSPLNVSLQNIVDALQGSNPAITSSEVTTQFRPTFRWAHAFSPFLGMQSALGFLTNSGDEGADTGAKGIFGVGFDGDFRRLWDVPISLSLSYARNQILARPAKNSDTFAVGLFESTTTAFNVGANLAWTAVEGNTTTSGILTFRSYFN
jgi:hypothetical protein